MKDHETTGGGGPAVARLLLAAVAAVALIVLLLALCVWSGVFSSDPLDKKVDVQTYQQDLERILDGMDPEDQTALMSGLLLSYYKQEDLSAKTYRQFLEAGRRMQQEFMDTVSHDMNEFFVRDSLERDSLKQAAGTAQTTER